MSILFEAIDHSIGSYCMLLRKWKFMCINSVILYRYCNCCCLISYRIVSNIPTGFTGFKLYTIDWYPDIQGALLFVVFNEINRSMRIVFVETMNQGAIIVSSICYTVLLLSKKAFSVISLSLQVNGTFSWIYMWKVFWKTYWSEKTTLS